MELDPEFAHAQALLGNTYVVEYVLGWNRDPSLLVRSLNQGLRIDPRSSSTTLGIVAFVNYRAGRVDEAMAMLEQARAGNPDFLQPRLVLAALHESEGRREEARVLIREVLRVNPDLTPEDAVGLIAGATDLQEPLGRAWRSLDASP